MKSGCRWLLLLAVLLVAAALLTFAGRYLIYSDPPEAADIAVILSGNDSSRIEEAAKLYQAGYVANVMLTNTGQTYSEYQLPYTMLQVEQLKESGIPEGGIYLAEFNAKNTGQEATGIINKMYELGFQSAIIVTDSWHTRRVKIIFSDSFGNTGFRFQIHPASGSGFDRNFWWLTGSGWQHVGSEYLRILGYLIKKHTNIPDYPNIPW